MKTLVATFLALSLSLATHSAIAGDAAAGKAKSPMCAGCHGQGGISVIPSYPNLAGQKEAYLIKALKDFRSKARTDAIMNAMTAGLTDTDISNLAAFFSSQK
mgnify:CR=1 FL=1